MAMHDIVEAATSLKSAFDNPNASEDDKRKCFTYAYLMGMECFVFDRYPQTIADAFGAPQSELRGAFVKGIKYMIDEQPVESIINDNLLTFIYGELQATAD